jgi:dolichol-phosphate mannosyltransferase
MRLAVVIPMFNEEAGARRCVDRVGLAIEGRTDIFLVVIDDGSRDGTVSELREAQRGGACFEIVEGSINRGYGRALRTGAEHAAQMGADWVLFMDSDLTNPPEQIGEFSRVIDDQLDMVKACRYCPGGSTGDVPFRRMIVSRCGNLLARWLMAIPHRDLTNGFRAFPVSRYLALELTEPGFAVILEEAYWVGRSRLRTAELPTALTDRASDLRPTSFRYSPQQVWAYLRWPLRSAKDRVVRLFVGR